MEWAPGPPGPPGELFPFNWLTFVGGISAGLVAIWWTGAKLFTTVRHPLVRRAARTVRPRARALRTLAILMWAASSLIPASLLWALVSLVGASEAVAWLVFVVGEALWMSLTEPALDKVLARLPPRKAAPGHAAQRSPTERA